MKIIFLNSHPISYFSDLYKFLSNYDINFQVWYCSDYGVKKHYDVQFKSYRKIKGLLEGFNYKFLTNLNKSSRAKEKIFDTINPSIFKELSLLKKGDLIICHGWSRLTMLIVILFSKFYKLKVGLRSETPINQEKTHKGLKKYLRNLFLKLIFSKIDYFFYIGTNNKKFYKSFDIEDSKLIFLPYSVNPLNVQQKSYSKTNKILFCGKLIEKKRPIDLLKAFSLLNNKSYRLIYAGSGKLERELIKLSKKLKINDKVIFKGLLTREELDDLYSSVDLLVLPSGYGETWGLVVNEALEYGLPIVVSDIVGCSIDLCNKNGIIFEMGSIDQLSNSIKKIINYNMEEYSKLRSRSLELKNKFSFYTIKDNLISFINDSEIKHKI